MTAKKETRGSGLLKGITRYTFSMTTMVFYERPFNKTPDKPLRTGS